MYGTVEYYSERLITSVMNRLVNEHANSLKECYIELGEEIKQLKHCTKNKTNLLSNLDKAYKLSYQYLNGVENEDIIDER